MSFLFLVTIGNNGTQRVRSEHFKFHNVVYSHCSGEVKKFISFCSKFIRETVYQISSVSLEFYR